MYLNEAFNCNYSFDYWIFDDHHEFMQELIHDCITSSFDNALEHEVIFTQIKKEYHENEGVANYIEVTVRRKNKAQCIEDTLLNEICDNCSEHDNIPDNFGVNNCIYLNNGENDDVAENLIFPSDNE
jgi:hypothetical protein